MVARKVRGLHVSSFVLAAAKGLLHLTRLVRPLQSALWRGLGARSVLYLGAVRRLGKQMDASET